MHMHNYELKEEFDIRFQFYNKEELQKLAQKTSINITPEMERDALNIRSKLRRDPVNAKISDYEWHLSRLYETRIRFPEFYAAILAQQNVPNVSAQPATPPIQNVSRPSAQSSHAFFTPGVTSAAVAAATVVTAATIAYMSLQS